MAELVTLTEDGPLGKAGDQVWVDSPELVAGTPEKPAKKAAAAKRTPPKKG